MNLQAMYSLLCDVQQSSVEEEALLRKLRSEVQNLNDRCTADVTSLDALRGELSLSERNLETLRQRNHILTARHTAQQESSRKLRHYLRVDAVSDDVALQNDLEAGWKRVAHFVSRKLAPVQPCHADPPTPARHPQHNVTEQLDTAETRPSESNRFAIRRGPPKKTLFQFSAANFNQQR